MSRIRIVITGELIAQAETVRSLTEWWAWPVEAALEELTHVDVDIDGDANDGCIATIGGNEDVTLVVGLGDQASAWLDARWICGDERKPGEPFEFDIEVPDWLVGLVSDAEDDPVVTCRACGCTDEQACAGGCVWIEDPEGLGDLCSSCGPAAQE